MQFLTLLAAATLAAAANTIKFVSQDKTSRTVVFTPNPGSSSIASVSVPGGQSITVSIPQRWQGNFYSYSAGKPNVPGMLGEVAMNSWGGVTFFDVSAIVNPSDTDGVKMMYPASTSTSSLTSTRVTSGCNSYVTTCANAYNLPDDVQTKATQETDLICTLGTSSNSARDVEEVDATEAPAFSREWVMGKWTPPVN